MKEHVIKSGLETEEPIERAEEQSTPVQHPGELEGLPLGTSAVTTTADADVPPGIIFCLRAEGAAARQVELNLEIKRAQAEHSAARAKL